MLADPHALTPHPFALERFPLNDERDDEELVESIRAIGVSRPLTITGERCASGPGVVLNGNRRRRAAIAARAAVPVRVLDDLNEVEEQRVVLLENLADQLGRRLTESRRAELEHELIGRLARGQGYRSDLATSAETSGGRGDTRDLVASETGATRNAIEDRRKIFFSPVAPASLRSAVDAGKLPRSVAARLVREAEKRGPLAGQRVEDAAPRIIEHVRDCLSAQVKQLAAGGKTMTRKSEQPSVVEANLEGSTAILVFRRRQLSVEVVGNCVRVVDLGPAPAITEGHPVFVWPSRPWEVPITAANWYPAVRYAIDLFPEDLRASVACSRPNFSERRCTDCWSSHFDSHDRCSSCVPAAACWIGDFGADHRDVLISVMGPLGASAVSATFFTHARPDRIWMSIVTVGRSWLRVQRGGGFNSLRELAVTVRRHLLDAMRTTHGLQWTSRDGYRRADGAPVGFTSPRDPWVLVDDEAM